MPAVLLVLCAQVVKLTVEDWLFRHL